jgi:hypothetical protein
MLLICDSITTNKIKLYLSVGSHVTVDWEGKSRKYNGKPHCVMTHLWCHLIPRHDLACCTVYLNLTKGIDI